VLQKLVGVGGEAGERLLCRQPEQLVDDVILSQDIPFGDPFQLAFAEHVHRFITLDGPLGRGKRLKSQPRVHAAFHKSMILFHNIIQILALSELTAFWQGAIVLEGVEG
jgi:hypothetical protein